MLGEHDVGLGKPFEQPVIDHVLRAAGELLSGLEDRQHGAGPLTNGLCEQGCGAEQAGRMHIVTAGVHDRDLAPVAVGGAGRAGVGQSGLLLDGKGVEIGTQQHHPTLPVAQYTDHARTADPLGHLQSRRPQAGSHPGRRAMFLQRQFGVLVKSR